MGRSPCFDATGLKKGPWTPEEDQKLLAYVQRHGHGSWRSLPEKAGLQRCGKSCRLRWTNYLRPDIKRGMFSVHEEQTIIQLHALLGNRWSAIAAHLPKRTDNEIKNYWNTHIKKRLAMMGIDPVTHRPKIATLGAADGDPKNASNLSHMAQWETARLEAEARLVKESKARHNEPTDHSSSWSHSGSTHSLNKMANRPCCLDIRKGWQNVCFKSFQRSIGTVNSNGSKTAIFGHGFCDGSDLESPISILQFCDQTQAPLSSIVSYDHSNKKLSTYGSEISEGFFNKFGNLDMVVDEAPISEASTTFGPPNTGDRDFLEGFSSLFNNHDDIQNITGSTSATTQNNSVTGSSHGEASEEENKNYWNNIINLVDCGVLSSI